LQKIMPMTEHKMLGDPSGGNIKRAEILKDERLAGLLSAYIDGELEGSELEEFESLLKSDAALAREVQEMRSIELRLMDMGSDILSEPVPEAMLEALSKIERG
jgi:anti-sigma factor RsiW